MTREGILVRLPPYHHLRSLRPRCLAFQGSPIAVWTDQTTLRLVQRSVLVALCLSFTSLTQATDSITSADPLTTSSLIYVSDYISFVGRDNQGRVAFALDNNRGRDGAKYQAEHLVVLHDERTGWVETVGSGAYPNSQRELAPIPNSPFFHFDGTPESGLAITSEKNDLVLRITPLPRRTQQEQNGGLIWMGSGPAELVWHGRTIRGRVIYEHLMMPNFNRLTRTYWGMWNSFQGFYLLAGSSEDLYLHTHRSERLAPLIAPLTGFSVLGEVPEQLNDVQVEVLDYDFAPGFFRWPKLWRITWTGSAGPGSMTLSLSFQKTLSSWLLGGFSMGILTGEVSYGGRLLPLYGLGELIM